MLQSQDLHIKGRSFSRSYGANLPSSLAGVLSSASGYSPYPRVSVYGTVGTGSRLEVFLGSMGSVITLTRGITQSIPQLKWRIFLPLSTPTDRYSLNQQTAHLPFCVTPSLKRTHAGAGI
jgi:hypothetical protein